MQQWTISQSDCDVWLKVDFNTTGNDQLSGWTEEKLRSTSHSQTCTKKQSCLVVCWRFHPLQLPESLRNITSEKYAQQVDEMPPKLQCLQPALVNRMGLILHDNTQLLAAQPMLQKWNKLGYKILPPLPYSPCYRDWAHSAYFRIRFERWGVEAKNLSLIQEDGTLTSQNNHLEESGWQVPLWIKDEGEVRK